MAAFERNFRNDAEAPLTLNELVGLLGEGAAGASTARVDAIACYLSNSEGWREAVKQLGGAFADEPTELKKNKAD